MFTSISGDSLLYWQILSAIALSALIWLAARSRGTRAPAEPQPTDLPRATSGQLAEIAERLSLVETALKAEKRDREDFEESVRRWQGRVNRQSSRDAQAAKEPERDEDDAQLGMFAGNGSRSPQQRPPARPVPLSQRFRRL